MNKNHPEATLRQLLARLKQVRRRHVRRLTWVRCGWLALALLLLLVYADATLALDAPIIRMVELGIAGVLGLCAAITLWKYYRPTSEERYVARLIEQGQPDLHNALLNAIDFSERLEQPNPVMTRLLMQEAIEQGATIGEQSFAQPITYKALQPAGYRRERGWLMWVASGAILGGILFSGVFEAVLPRLFDPYGDHPPYSPTLMIVDPAGATLDYGQNLIVRARSRGPLPSEVALVVEGPNKIEHRLPMFSEGTDSYFQTIEQVREPFVYHVAFKGGRSRRFVTQMSKIPRIENASATLRPPAYTHLPEEAHILSEPNLQGFTGTSVTLRLSSNRPLKGGELSIAGQQVQLAPSGQSEVSGVFNLTTTSQLVASIVDTEGNVSRENYKLNVKVVPDKKLEISLTSPGMDSFAIPDAKIPLVIEAQDDLGVKEVRLVRNLNGSVDAVRQMHESTETLTFVRSVETLDLGDLGVKPGDVIEYYAAASDTWPGGPHEVATTAYRLNIISFEEYREFAQTQTTAEDLAKKYDDIQERMNELAEQQKKLAEETAEQEKRAAQDPAATKEQAAATAKKQAELEAQTKEFIKSLREEAKQKPIFDIENDFHKELEKFADQIDSAAQSMQGAEKAMTQAHDAQTSTAMKQSLQAAQQAQQDALKGLGQSSEEMKQGIGEATKKIEAAARLQEDVEQFKNLYQQQKDLERQARTDAEAPTNDLTAQARTQGRAEEQANLKKDLDQLEEDFRQHAEAAKESHPQYAEDGQKIAEEMKRRTISESMQQAEEKFAQGDSRAGHPHSLRAKDQLEAMISFCSSQGGKPGVCDRLKISMGKPGGMNPGQTLDQLKKGMGGRAGLGRLGQAGQSDSPGGSTNFGFFGPQSPKASQKSSAMGPRQHKETAKENGVLPQLAGNVEEIHADQVTDLQVLVRDGEPVMQEYKPLIEAYFKRLAEER